jgi:hypothetical protein
VGGGRVVLVDGGLEVVTRFDFTVKLVRVEGQLQVIEETADREVMKVFSNFDIRCRRYRNFYGGGTSRGCCGSGAVSRPKKAESETELRYSQAQGGASVVVPWHAMGGSRAPPTPPRDRIGLVLAVRGRRT